MPTDPTGNESMKRKDTMSTTQDEANVKETLAKAEMSYAHARLMNAQAAELEAKTSRLLDEVATDE